MKKLLNYFIQGLVYIAPLAITAFIIYAIFSFLDGLFLDVIENVIGFHIPGLGVLIIAIILIIIGYIGQTIVAHPIKRLTQKLLDKVPILKIIYSAFNDLFSAFVGKHKKFNRPVMVTINKSAKLEKIGFLTEDDMSILGIKDKVAVYFPHSYNFSGELFIVPVENVRMLDSNPIQTMKFVVSAGVSGFDAITDENQ